MQFKWVSSQYPPTAGSSRRPTVVKSAEDSHTPSIGESSNLTQLIEGLSPLLALEEFPSIYVEAPISADMDLRTFRRLWCLWLWRITKKLFDHEKLIMIVVR